MKKKKVGTIYECGGVFKWVEPQEDEEEDDWDYEEEDEDEYDY